MIHNLEHKLKIINKIHTLIGTYLSIYRRKNFEGRLFEVLKKIWIYNIFLHLERANRIFHIYYFFFRNTFKNIYYKFPDKND